MGVPLGVTFAITVGVFLYASHWERERAHAEFERQAENLSRAIERDLVSYVEGFRSIAALYAGSQRRGARGVRRVRDRPARATPRHSRSHVASARARCRSRALRGADPQRGALAVPHHRIQRGVGARPGGAPQRIRARALHRAARRQRGDARIRLRVARRSPGDPGADPRQRRARVHRPGPAHPGARPTACSCSCPSIATTGRTTPSSSDAPTSPGSSAGRSCSKTWCPPHWMARTWTGSRSGSRTTARRPDVVCSRAIRAPQRTRAFSTSIRSRCPASRGPCTPRATAGIWWRTAA